MDAKEEAAQQAAVSSPSQNISYADRDVRITKENLYMVLALHMETFPVEREEEIGDYHKVGAVLVLPNDMIYAVDCSRNGVHGAARLLMAHQGILQDCKVFVSRKPCSLCTKLLVQSKVKRVFYLPIEPEYGRVKDFDTETSRVDDLFKVSSIGQSVFVPRVEQEVRAASERKKSVSKTKTEALQKQLMSDYWNNDEWIDVAQSKLPWPAFDVNMSAQVHKDFQSIANWMAHVLIKSEMGDSFKALTEKESKSFDPCRNVVEHKQAIHLMKLAFFLAERTDDPRKGVGAVIVNKRKDVVGLGWNGFPTKSLYGEFPRATDKDPPVGGKADKKYPYIIHAEQNALLLRNTKNIVDATLIVTMTPCDDCTPLIEMQGIKTVVLGEKMRRDTRGLMNFTKFPQRVDDKDDPIVCFELQKQPQSQKRKADDDSSGETEEIKSACKHLFTETET